MDNDTNLDKISQAIRILEEVNRDKILPTEENNVLSDAISRLRTLENSDRQ